MKGGSRNLLDETNSPWEQKPKFQATVTNQELVHLIATAWGILSKQKDLIRKSFSGTGVIASGDRVKTDLIMSNAYEKAVKDIIKELHIETVESEDKDHFAQFDSEEMKC